LLALAVLPVSCDSKRDENPVVLVPTDDPDMRAAIGRARDSLDGFLALAANPPANASDFKLKVMVRDGTNTEHFWVTPFRHDGDAFEGILTNEPKYVRSVKLGEAIKFSRTDVSDWGYIADGRQVGGFTVCVMFKRMLPEQADQYRRSLGFDC